MDSGLGSDEERRVLRLTTNPLTSSADIGSTASTKEQKQRHNERLLIGCFIDASSLSDDTEVVPPALPLSTSVEASSLASVNRGARNGEQKGTNNKSETVEECSSPSRVANQWSNRVQNTAGNSSSSSNGEEERRQGALLFRTSIPQYSMLQMELNMHHRLMADSFSCSSQTDYQTDYDDDKEDGREKDVPALLGDCDNISNSSNFSRQTSLHEPSIPVSQVYPLNYCNDNDLAASCTHTTTVSLIKNEKFHQNGRIESSTACATPFNSIVQLIGGNVANISEEKVDSEEIKRKSEEEAESHKTSLGFYVDLNEVEEPQPSASSVDTSRKKNIFSMVIDFEAPKKEKPKLASSIIRSNANVSKFADGNGKTKKFCEQSTSKREVSSAGTIPKLTTESIERPCSSISNISINQNEQSTSQISDESENDHDKESPKQFVKLSDLDGNKKPDCNESVKHNNSNNSESKCDQHVMLDLNKAGVSGLMSRSIPPPQSFVESPMFLNMSRSIAAYRSSPPPFSSHSHQRTGSLGSRTPLTSNSRPSSGGSRSVGRLGTDLLRMFLEEIETDVQVSVDGRTMRAHRCILVSRCQYFAASLSGRSGSGSASSDFVIPLDGFSYDSVHFAMCHIYSGASHVPDSVSLVELASLADLLCLEGLKEVVSSELQLKHCHSFHSPCIMSPKTNKHNKRTDTEGGCVEGIMEVLPLAAAYGLDELYQRCLQWIAEHYIQIWPTRAFGQLPRELRDKCHRYMEVHLTPETVLDVIIGTLEIQKVLETKPCNSRWVEVVAHLTRQLKNDCQNYIIAHLLKTLEYIHCQLGSVKKGHKSQELSDEKIGLMKLIVKMEDIFLIACKSLSSPEQLCRNYSKCRKMIMEFQISHGETLYSFIDLQLAFIDTLSKIETALEERLIVMGDRVLKCPSWETIEEKYRCRIKQLQVQLRQQEKDDDSSLRSTPGSRGSICSPPATRLPRATKTTQARENHAARKRQQQQGSSHPLLQSSSESSSRNSSPLTSSRRIQMSSNKDLCRTTNTGSTSSSKPPLNAGSPSLRRSLLMAARVPQQSQVPPSPLQVRKTTKTSNTVTSANAGSAAAAYPLQASSSRSRLTQPTASSAAKSAPAKHVRSSTSKDVHQKYSQQKSQSAPTSVRVDISSSKVQNKYSTSMSKSTQSVSAKIDTNRSNKQSVGVKKPSENRINRATTPTLVRKKGNSGASSGASSLVSPSNHNGLLEVKQRVQPSDNISSRPTSSKGTKPANKKDTVKITEEKKPFPEDVPTIQRSGTFLKEKPTVLTIEHQQQSITSDFPVH